MQRLSRAQDVSGCIAIFGYYKYFFHISMLLYHFILQICLLIIRIYNSNGDTDTERGGTSYAMLCARMTREGATENKLELSILLIHKSTFVSLSLEAINAPEKSF